MLCQLNFFNCLLVAAMKGKECKYIEVAPYERCSDIGHLERYFQDIIDGGGEGIILRDPSSPYQPGNSLGYLKHKKFRDAEARILSVVAPSLYECELYCTQSLPVCINFFWLTSFLIVPRPNGVRFTAPAGTTEFARRWQPKEGDIISFKHRGFLLSSHKPKLPTVYRLRTDTTWEDVVRKHKDNTQAIPRKGKVLRSFIKF